jgi:hypothetical protein
MSALARNHVTDAFTPAANDDCINGGSCNRTKYSYVNNNPLTMGDPTGFDDCLSPCVKQDGGSSAAGGGPPVSGGMYESMLSGGTLASMAAAPYPGQAGQGQGGQGQGSQGQTDQGQTDQGQAGQGQTDQSQAGQGQTGQGAAQGTPQGDQQGPLQEVIVNGSKDAPPLLAQEFFFGSAQEYQNALENWYRSGMNGPRPTQPLTPEQPVPAVPKPPPVTSPVNPTPQPPPGGGWWPFWISWILQRIFGAGSAPPLSPVAPPSTCYNNPNCA